MLIRQDSLPCDASLRSLPSATTVGAGVVSAAPGCAICASLADIDGRYFGRLLHDARARNTLAQSIMTSMGFCARHLESIAARDRREAAAIEALIRDARRHLGALFERATLQDDLVQDVLFGARARCPACAYFHRAEGRAAARALQDAARAGQHRRGALPELCFVHLQRLLARTDPPMRTRITRRLRAKAKTMARAFDASASGDAAAQRADLLRRLVYPLAAQTVMQTVMQPATEAESAQPAACPICTAVAQARRHWLAMAADNVRLAQPGWIALPTCHTHLLQCLDHDTALQNAALARFIEAALPARSAAAHPDEAETADTPKRRRRARRRWFDAKAGAPDAENAYRPRISCPGCEAEAVAAQSAIAASVRAAAKAKDDETIAAALAGVCLKHCAEMLIYAPDPHTAQRLCRALCAVLRDDNRAPPLASAHRPSPADPRE